MLLFIGASSFLGKNFQEIYPESYVGTFYNGLNFFDKNHKFNNMKLEKLDVNNKEDADRLFKKYSVNTVILAAAIISSKNKNDYYKINVGGVRNIIESMKQNGSGRIIYISTAVLELEENLWGEYGRTKYLAEEIVKNSGLDYVILRPTEIYGKYEKEGMAKLIKLVKKFPVFPLINGGKNMLSPIRAEDVCRVIMECLRERKHDNKIHLLCGGERVSFKGLILRIGQYFNKKVFFIPIPKFLFCWLIGPLAPFINKNQILKALSSRAYDSSPIEAEFGLKFKGADFSYLKPPHELD